MHSLLQCLATLRKRQQRVGATQDRREIKSERIETRSRWEWTRGKTIPCMLASSQGSQDNKSLNSLFFPAIIGVKDKYTCVTNATPF